MDKITEFDRNTVQKLRNLLDEALKSLKDDYGIVVNIGNMRYGSDHVTIRCEALLDSGSGLDAYEQSVRNNVKMYGHLFGLTMEMVGKIANIPNRGTCILLGCKPRSHKYPIVWKETHGNRDKFKSTKEYLKYLA